MIDRFQKRTNKFIDWFSSLPGSSISPKVAPADYRSRKAGRGLVALENIREGEQLFEIPRASILTTSTSHISTVLPDLTPKPWPALILTLMYEHFQGKHSPWYRYLEILPDASEFDTLMYWSDAELDELQASAVRGKIGKDSADEQFRAEVLPVIEQHSQVFYPAGVQPLSPAELMALAHRMGSTIMAYAFDLELEPDHAKEVDEDGFESDDEGVILRKGMLPLADMLNADADFNARLFGSPDALAMIASRPIAKDEEILNDYGPLPRSDLLRRYGYITQKYAQYDAVEIPHDMIMEHVKQQFGLNSEELSKRLEYLEDIEVLDDGYDVERWLEEPGDFPARIQEELLHLLKTLSCKDGNYKKLDTMAEAQQAELMPQVSSVLRAVLGSRLGQYATSIEEDEAILKQETLGRRHRMAVEVRLGEKELLRDAMVLVGSWTGKDGPQQGEADTQPAQKRQRID